MIKGTTLINGVSPNGNTNLYRACYRAPNGTALSAGFALIPYSIKVYNIGDIVTYNSSDMSFTVNKTGLYIINATNFVSGLGASKRRGIRLDINGIITVFINVGSPDSGSMGNSGVRIIQLNQGDKITVYNISTSDVTIDSGTTTTEYASDFTIVKLDTFII